MTPLIIWFILGSFATHRLALMVSKEDGPAWIFRKLRKLPPPKSSAREGLSCIYCVSVYAAALVTGLLYTTIELEWRQVFIFWLAVSSGSIGINSMFTKG